MKAACYEAFGGPIVVRDLPRPTAPAGGVVLRVDATGLCRSDWHGWQGHDPDIQLPHVPGHEVAGTVTDVGSGVTRWVPGDRVTLPFVCGCGHCPPCCRGDQQVCDHQFQPGFTAHGSFAEYVAIRYADHNLVRLPESVDMVSAASLGCRFATSFRALVSQGRVTAGDWVAVYGCGGVGLSAIMIAAALGASPIGIDVRPDALALARDLGAAAVVNATETDPVAAVLDLSSGGVQISMDALGHAAVCSQSVLSLAKRGRHVQVGLTLGEDSRPPLPMDRIVAYELEILGSHGMQAHQYPRLMAMMARGVLDPGRLVTARVSLSEGICLLHSMGVQPPVGIAVIDRFE